VCRGFWGYCESKDRDLSIIRTNNWDYGSGWAHRDSGKEKKKGRSMLGVATICWRTILNLGVEFDHEDDKRQA
jgi:hypothetical protein